MSMVMRTIRQMKNIKISSIVESLIAIALTIVVLQSIFEKESPKKSSPVHRPILSRRPQKFRHVPMMRILEKLDWHDKKFIENEKNRSGNGEHGAAANFTSQRAPEDVEKSWKLQGFNAILSDDISLERSLPDVRHQDCQSKMYIKDLPSVSIIIPIRNDHKSVLARTLTSIINRTPKKLIKEILLVDDCSTTNFVTEKLEDFVDSQFPDTRIKVIRLKTRVGPILAKNAGAEVASGKVLVFLDSQIEVNVNWLPPLLDPLVENYKVVTTPVVDIIDSKTFQYKVDDDGNSRILFDWNLSLKRFPLTGHARNFIADGHQSPVMTAIFAITSKYFKELEGFDPGLKGFGPGGENFEMSFKIWQCSGEILEMPCSRLGHIYRDVVENITDHSAANLKRVAEVWMDDYKEILYRENIERFKHVKTGDLSSQHELRQKLKCKSFKWFLQNRVPDLIEIFPPEEKMDFASGVIREESNKKMCLTLKELGSEKIGLGLGNCPKDLIHPPKDFHFALTWHRDLRLKGSSICLQCDTYKESENTITLDNCHSDQGNQMWRYFPKTKELKSVTNKLCLETDPTHSKVYAAKCDLSNNQRWSFGYQNAVFLEKWEASGVAIKS